MTLAGDTLLLLRLTGRHGVWQVPITGEGAVGRPLGSVLEGP